MLRYEKAGIVLILTMIMLILAFSVLGNLRMLIIEKEEDIATLRAMGLAPKSLRRIFRLEGYLISLGGMAVGCVIGIALCLLQEHFGIIQMPGNFVVQAYPIALEWTDVILTMGIIAAASVLTASIAGKEECED